MTLEEKLAFMKEQEEKMLFTYFQKDDSRCAGII